MKHLAIFMLTVLTMTACGEKSQPALKAPSEQKPQSSNGNYGNNGFDPFANNAFSVTNTCTYENKDECERLRVNIKAADVQSSQRVGSTIDGRAREPIALAFTVEAKSSRYESGVADAERVAMGFRKLPRDADTQIEGLTAALIWEPREEGRGSFDVVFRDVGRCIVEEAYDSDGDLDEDKAADCEDMEKTAGMSKYEESKTFSYRLEKSTLELQKDAAIQQLDSQCKLSMMTSMIGAVPALFGGNPTGIFTAGATGMVSQMQCDAQKEQIEAQFDAQTIQ